MFVRRLCQGVSVAALVSSVGLFGVQGLGATASAAPAVTTISYFTYSAAPDHLKDLATIIQAFEKQNPTIKVKVETDDYADYFTKLTTEIAGGDAPDTFELDYQDFVNYAASGALLDLAPLDKGAAAYNPKLYTRTALDAFDYQGKQMGLPEDFSDVLLFFNENLFQAAHLPLPTSSWTWNQEMAAGKKLTNGSKGTWGLFQPVTFNEFYKALNQAGGQFFNAGKTKAMFNSPAGVAAAEHLISKLGTTMPTLAQIGNTPNFDTNLFESGKLAMWINGNWQFSGISKVPFKWNVVVEPGDTTKASAVFLDGVAAYSKTKNAQAALKWLKFFTSANVSVLTRVQSNWELAPVSNTSLESSYLTATPPTNRQAVFQAVYKPSFAPVISQENQMEDIVNNALTKAADGSGTVQSDLNQAAQQVDALLPK
jgi:multiple sugar transport system substrate-binding protein